MMTTSAQSGRFLKITSLLAALALSASACGGSSSDAATDAGGGDSGSGLSGTLVGAGASSQAAAMQGWQAGFQTANPDVTVEYDPIGSGGGRETFLAGGSSFAGSDRAINEEEYTASKDVCAGDQGAVNLPHYISPIAVAYNLPSVTDLKLTTAALAGIFAGEITNWNDPAIADANPDAELPDLTINPVHRSDESGTSANFTDYLGAVEPDVWTFGSIEVWPDVGGEGAQGTSGVVAAIGAGEGSIGYADASQVGSLGTAAIQVGEDFVPYSPEAAAKIMDVSNRVALSDNDYSFELVRDTTESGTYPIVLVSYHIVCLEYADAATADLVREFMLYVGSAEGQEAAAASAGSAPISDTLRGQLEAVVNQITGG
ncbi:MAG: phosphate ABC transporter substrate-binding protein PstS [Acidimicrobiales bacterium]